MEVFLLHEEEGGGGDEAEGPADCGYFEVSMHHKEGNHKEGIAGIVEIFPPFCLHKAVI